MAEQYNFFPLRNYIHFHVKIFYCSSHPTWLPSRDRAIPLMKSFSRNSNMISRWESCNKHRSFYVCIAVLFRLCCHGFVCPPCPKSIRLHVLNNNLLMNSSLYMTCKWYSYTSIIRVLSSPGLYDIQASYTFFQMCYLCVSKFVILEIVHST
jgi:hypothetical protein